MTEFAFPPSVVRAPAGRLVRLVLVTRRQIPHQFETVYLYKTLAVVVHTALRVEANGVEFVRLQPGGTATLTFLPGVRGRVPFACTIEGDREGLRRWREESAAGRFGHRLRAASDPELREDRRDVVVDRPERQVKLLGHLGVAQPFGDELENLHLSGRQPRRMGARGRPGAARDVSGPQLTQAAEDDGFGGPGPARPPSARRRARRSSTDRRPPAPVRTRGGCRHRWPPHGPRAMRPRPLRPRRARRAAVHGSAPPARAPRRAGARSPGGGGCPLVLRAPRAPPVRRAQCSARASPCPPALLSATP